VVGKVPSTQQSSMQKKRPASASLLNLTTILRTKPSARQRGFVQHVIIQFIPWTQSLLNSTDPLPNSIMADHRKLVRSSALLLYRFRTPGSVGLP